jgi:hypothetical protein
MTPAQLASALSEMRWTNTDLGVLVGVDERQVRRWLARGDIPERIAAWVALRLALHRAHPCPPGPLVRRAA